MQVVIVPSKEIGARIVADAIERLINWNPDFVLGLATGSSPIPLYNELVSRKGGIDRDPIEWLAVTTFNLDEYHPIDPAHPDSYRSFMHRHFFDLLGQEPHHIHLLDGQAKDVEDHCRKYEQSIIDAGGIDLQILGIGNNAHIAFNEPGSPFDSRTRRVELDKATRQANKRFFDDDITKVPTHALTMGMGTIMAARQIFLLASGEAKAQAIANAVEGPVTTRVPASALQLHGNATFVVDPAAASLLRRDNYVKIADY